MPDQFSCPPLSARISEKQCNSNRKRAFRSIKLLSCRTCAGVRELVRIGLTDPPHAWGDKREMP